MLYFVACFFGDTFVNGRAFILHIRRWTALLLDARSLLGLHVGRL